MPLTKRKFLLYLNRRKVPGSFVYRLIALVWAIFGHTQPTVAQQLDSLTSCLIKDADSAQQLFNTNHDKEAFALLRTALGNPARNQSPLGSLHLYYQLGVGERKVSHLEKALAALQQANQLALQLGDSTQLSRISYKLSVVYSDLGNKPAAVDQCHRTLAYAIHLPNTDYQSSALLLLTYLYKALGNPTLANEYGVRFVPVARHSTNFSQRMLGEWHLAKSLNETGQYRQATAGMTRVLNLIRASQLNNKADYLMQMLGELAHIHRQHRQWKPAMNALRETLYWEKGYHLLAVKAGVYTEMAGLLSDQGKPEPAVLAGERALAIARQTHRPDILLPALEILQQVQAQNGQYRAAWQTAKSARQLADSLFGIAKTQTIAQIETNHKVAAKESIIQGLQKDRRIRTLQVTARLHELTAIKQQQAWLLTVLAVLAGFVGVIGYLLIRTWQLQKQTEQQRQLLEGQTDELQAVNADKDKLFSIISHDLRAPVNNLRYLLRSVQQTPIQSDAWASVVAQLTNQIDQLGQLINNLLYWSLNQQGQLRDRSKQVLLGEILADYRMLLLETIRHKSLQVEMNGVGAYVWADEAQVQLIIRNLLDNAIKFAPAGSLITILWTSEPTGVYLDITNQIAFKTEPGANLGIRIVTELLKRQGGSITIDQSQASVWRVRVHWPAQPVMPSNKLAEFSTERGVH